MHPSDPLARALSARSTLPPELAGLDSDPLWAALLTSVQNVVLGEIRRARYPELADESQRDVWPELLDRLGHDARVRVGREVVDGLTVGTVDVLRVSWMRVAGGASGAGPVDGDPDAMGEQAVSSSDPVVQERIVDLLELLGEVVDAQLAGRFGVLPDESRPETVEFSLSDAGPAPEPVAVRPPEPVAEHLPKPVALVDAGLVVSLPPALAEPPAQPAAVPTFDWAPGPSHPTVEPAEPAEPKHHSVPPAAPGWRPLPTVPAGRTPASFGRRAAAFLIDRAITILIATVAVLLFVWPAAAYTSSTPRPAAGSPLLALAVIGVGVVSIGWFLVVAWLIGTRGASPGKRLMRVEVVGFSSPGPIGFGRALLRELVLAAFTIGSVLTVWLPYASVFWDSTKQLRGWHDKAVDDIVVDTATL